MSAGALKLQRAPQAGAELNARELAWWNANAGTIAKVWEMAPEVSWAVRRAYLERARKFFLAGRERVTLLELGCGSGWLGQSIAGPSLRIIGTDFSESQITLARERAAANGLSAFCEYHVADAVHWAEDARAADGAVIHAFLHHLDDAEIDSVLRGLRARLQPGARVWIYEPAFLEADESAAGARSDPLAWLLKNAVQACSALVRAGAGALGLRDEATAKQFERLAQMAGENGWYLSPKEIPFFRGQFTQRIERVFALRDCYWATLYLVGWAFEFNLLRSTAIRKAACATVLPLAARCDRFLCGRPAHLAAALRPPNHGFAVWECEVPA